MNESSWEETALHFDLISSLCSTLHPIARLQLDSLFISATEEVI